MNERKELMLSGDKRKKDYYDANFEKLLLERLKVYYKNNSISWLSMSVPEYLTTIQNALTFEEDQCQYYYEKSKEKMLATTEREMITEHLETLVKNDSSGLYHMINKSEKKDLILFYKLSKRGDQVNQQILGRNYATYIETVGQKIIQDNKDPIEYTKKFLELKSYMDEVVSTCFDNDINFQNQRDNGFKQSLNHFEKSPGFLATYLDF
eukprot:CAMPEP_0114580020 /NCGR_PEP_ID=MMETSP0125-20121206/4353_1 /TAXON_ID=485358 ORGANISM="Aristerostoma sp., Strain ATCC 50986" /NCGR_SAMPLE_ID=MMETSP0125 /ASSEMBLY_ACC=CAM_ASM_000245 /LENGTH=208 /DNA_ID=CAMNT_0001771259 /DNA_START=590 /DNA_END=1216 /DNA_ORIENTATION=-